MSDWMQVTCTSCGWEQQYPQHSAIFAFKCDKCQGGAYRVVDKTIADPPDKKASDEGFMCQVQCKGCLAPHNWSQAALNNRGFMCDWLKCGCTDYRLVGVTTPNEKASKNATENISEKVPSGRSTAPMFDLSTLDNEDLIYLVQALSKKLEGL